MVVRRRRSNSARLMFFYGPMDCGKSTLALQTDHNLASQGQRGLRLVSQDRAGAGRISSRLGLTVAAVEVTPDLDLIGLVEARLLTGDQLDYLLVDEAQFLSPVQVEQLGLVVDEMDIDVYAYGILTDFRSLLFPGASRLIELADRLERLQVEVLCWCGRPGLLNARVRAGRVQREGERVLVADTNQATGAAQQAGRDSATDGGSATAIAYRVLCRQHHRAGQLAPALEVAGQEALALTSQPETWG